MAWQSTSLRFSALVLVFGCTAWARSAAALNCGTPPPRLEFTYPDESTPPIAPDAVFWAVGTTEVVLTAAYLDDGVELTPSGAAPPANWMFVPPEPLDPGEHSVRFVFENFHPGDEEDLEVRFEVREAASAPRGPDAVPLTFTRAVRFPEFSTLYGVQRPAFEVEVAQLRAEEGDCTQRVDEQRELCFWFEHGGLPDIWGRADYVASQPLWTGLASAGDVLGHVIGERFVPAGCRGVLWYEDRFAERVEAVPLYPSGLGAPVVLDEERVTAWVPPSDPLIPSGAPAPCSVARGSIGGQRSSSGAIASLLVLVLVASAAGFARRRAAARARCPLW